MLGLSIKLFGILGLAIPCSSSEVAESSEKFSSCVGQECLSELYNQVGQNTGTASVYQQMSLDSTLRFAVKLTVIVWIINLIFFTSTFQRLGNIFKWLLLNGRTNEFLDLVEKSKFQAMYDKNDKLKAEVESCEHKIQKLNKATEQRLFKVQKQIEAQTIFSEKLNNRFKNHISPTLCDFLYMRPDGTYFQNRDAVTDNMHLVQEEEEEVEELYHEIDG